MPLLVGRLLATLLDPLLEGFERPHQIPSPVERLLESGTLGIAYRIGGFGQLPLEVTDVTTDLLLELAGILRRAGTDEATGVSDLLLELALTNAVRRILQRARRVALVATEFGRGRIELPLEVGHLRLHLVLALCQPADAVYPLLVRQAFQSGNLVGNVRFFLGKLVRPPLRIFDVTGQTSALLAL